MKVIIIVNTIRPGTGGFASIRDLAVELAASGHKVDIGMIQLEPLLSRMYKKNLRFFQTENIRFHYIPGFRTVLGQRDGFIGYLYSLRTISSNTSIVFENVIKGVIEIFMAELKRSEIIFFKELIRKSDIVIKSVLLSGYDSANLRRLTSAKVIQNHAGSPETFKKYWLNETHRSWKNGIDKSLYISFCLDNDYILFQSKDQADECVNQYKTLINRVIVLPPTCDERSIENSYKTDSPYKKNTNSYIIVNVGTIQPRKAQHNSIKAFAVISKKYSFAQLHFIGSWKNQSIYFRELRDLTTKMKLTEKVFFHGHRDDYLKYMIHADLLLQNSKSEGVSRVLREAMYMKLPIVCYSISGTSNILTNEKDALLAPPGNLKKLVHAICRLIGNRMLGVSIANSAYNRYNQVHSRIIYRKTMLELFRKIANKE